MNNMIKKLVNIHCPPHFSSLISPPSSLISHFSFLLLTLALPAAVLADHSHCLCGASGSAAHCATDHTQTAITWTEWTSNNSLPTTAGNYYLANDVTLTATYEPPTGINLCLNGHVVKQSTAAATVIKVKSGRTFTVTDCDSTAVHNFKVDANGLWTLTSDAKTVDFENLTARPAENTVVAVKGGVITGTGASDSNARGIDVYGTNTLYHVNVIGNKSNSSGAGVYVGVGSGILNGEGCRICGNVSSGDSGGGVMNFSTVNLRNSKLSFNKCDNYGGGLDDNGAASAKDNNGTGTLTDCEIIGNEAKYGGGVHNGWKTTLKGTTVIAGNTASTLGGGVSGYGFGGWENAGQVTIDGRNVCITGNTCTADAVLNNYAQETGYPINLTGDEALGAARIGIGQFKNDSGKKIDPPAAVTAAGAGSGTAADVAYFTSDDLTYIVVYNTDHLELKIPDIKVQPTAVDNTTFVVTTNGVPVELVGGEYLVPSNSVNVKVVYTASNTCYFADGSTAKTNDVVTSTNPATLPAAPDAPQQHKHCLCGASGSAAHCAAAHTQTELIWKAWTSTTSLPTTADNWYLVNDVTISTTYQPPTGVNLCLNGHVVKNGGSCDKLVNISGTVFTLTDCADTPHYFNKVNAGYRTDVFVYSLTTSPSASSVCVKGGCITGGYGWSGSPTHSPSMNVVSGGTFNFYRGNIVGNSSEQTGAGMLVNSGATLNMYGGNVEGNYSYWGFCNLNGTANIYGGSFRNNGNGPSGIACNGVTTIYDIEVSGNVSYDGVAGLYAGGTFTMLGGKVFGNRTTKVNGGLCIATANATIGGNVCVTGNYCNATREGFNYSGGIINNLYLPADKTVAVSTTTPLAAGAKIGVTTETTPTATSWVSVTGVNTTDYIKNFRADKGYAVVNDANVVKLADIPLFYVEFNAGRTDVKRDGATFISTNAVITYGSTVGVPVLTCEDLTLIGWSKTAGSPTAEYKTAEEVSTMTTDFGSSHTLYAVWGAEVRIPLFVALDGLGVVPQDGRTYEFSITNGSATTPLQPCCTNLVLACPTGTGDVYRVGFATNDVTNPWTLTLGEGTYIYDIRQRTVARPGEQLAEGTWRTCVKVDFSAKPYVTLTNNEYLDAIDDLSEGAFKAFIKSGQADFSSVARYIILGSDTQKVGDSGEFNRALVKSKFAFDFSRSFRVDGTMQVGNAADGTAIGFVPNGQDLVVSSDFNDGGSALGCYCCSKNGNGLFLEFDTLGDGYGWGGQADYIGETAHFVLTTTDKNGNPSNVKGQNVVFSNNYALPSEVMSYSIDYDSFSKEMLFTIKTTTQTWKLAYTNPPAVFGGMKAYMTLSGAMRYSPANSYGVGSYGSAAPKTKITIATFNYVNDSMTGAVENTFRNRQEALVTYNAWGGEIVPGEETTQAFANVARYDTPVNPERSGYDFLGWFVSWTNGAVQAVHGVKMDPIVDHTVYAKWISKATPKDQGEKVVDFEPVSTNADGSAVVGDGAILKGATNALATTDLAVPEFTKNGADGVPYVIIKRGSFSSENYDKKRALELRAAGVPRAYQTTNNLTSVTISSYVTNIQASAFQGCESLTNVTFTKTRNYLTGEPTKLHISDWAFRFAAVRTISFPAGSTVVLDYGSFADAQYLEDIYFRGDVEVADLYPFSGAGARHFSATGEPVKLHLSAKLASDPAFVAALTNGMSAVRIELDQDVIGATFESCSAPTVGANTVAFTFKVDSMSDWTVVNEDTVYLFWSTTLDPNTFIGNPALKPRPGELTKNADGSWTAVFDKPLTSGSASTFFKLRIGAER